MKRVVVIGGGFAGACVAKNLEKEFAVTLIDTKDYFEFTPSILRTIVEPGHVKKIQVLHLHYLKRAKVVYGTVQEVKEHEVILKNRKKIPFDYLAVCSGSSYNLPIKEQNVVTTARGHHLRDCYEQLCKANKILIIGGGLVGVELAAEIIEHYKGKEVTLVHSREQLMQRNHPKAIKYATNFLVKRGVKIIYGQRVIKRKGKYAITDKGKKLETDMVFLCTGIKPNGDFMKKHFSDKLNDRHQIRVNEYLQMEDTPHIFVAGDVTDRKEEKTAQNAEKESMTIVANMKALAAKKSLQEYVSHKRPMAISLGKWHGILECKNFVLTGFLPGLLKGFIEWKTMVKYKK